MAHRPMYCSNAVGDTCENHENAVSCIVNVVCCPLKLINLGVISVSRYGMAFIRIALCPFGPF